MKKQAILGLLVITSLLVLVSSAQAHNITLNKPETGDILTGNYTINATTVTTFANVNFTWSTNNLTWFDIGTNDTMGTEFTYEWNTTELCNGNYTVNATTEYNASIETHSSYANITINNDAITLVTPAAGATISGIYTFTATTLANRSYVNFSYSNDNGVTWVIFGNNSTEGTEFTVDWNTSNVSDGTYYFNATSNCTILDERTETDENQGVVIDNVADAVVDSPEFTPITVACLIGLLSVTAILLRKKKE